VRYHEHFVAGETLCVVMAYCEGGDLSREIKRRATANKPFSEAQVRRLTLGHD
jgi:serine/threonine protein kinase